MPEPWGMLHTTLLKTEPELALHNTSARLCRDLAERCGVAVAILSIDIEIGIARLRMVQDVLRIEANLKTLGFRDLESLSQIGIEAPLSQTYDRPVPQITLL